LSSTELDGLDRGTLERLDAELAEQLRTCDAAKQEADKLVQQLREEKLKLTTERKAVGQRASETTEALGPVGERESKRQRLEAALHRCDASYAEALREREAWAAAAPDDEAIATLTATADAASATVTHLRRRRSQLDLEIAELEGALRRDETDGAGAEITLLEERLADADGRVRDLELEVAALSMLEQRLSGQGSRHREFVLRPVIERLRPLLAGLFPGSTLALEGPLLVSHLERGGKPEALARLSDGTREQLALLVRLAYARMMADRGTELPVVLDDALVYADDERLASMFGLMAGAAQHHQVLVLSCRADAFGRLADRFGACRPALVPWDEAAEGRLGRGEQAAMRRAANA
jgi:uncharacterized protein YhaN